MNIGLLLVSHGNASFGIKDTIRVIMGEQEDLIALSILEGDDPSKLLNEMKDVLEKYGDNLITLLDVFGGTPCNTALRLSKDYHIHALTGMNVPMVMEAIALRNGGQSVEDIIKELSQVGKDSIIDLTETISLLRQ